MVTAVLHANASLDLLAEMLVVKFSAPTEMPWMKMDAQLADATPTRSALVSTARRVQKELWLSIPTTLAALTVSAAHLSKRALRYFVQLDSS